MSDSEQERETTGGTTGRLDHLHGFHGQATRKHSSSLTTWPAKGPEQVLKARQNARTNRRRRTRVARSCSDVEDRIRAAAAVGTIRLSLEQSGVEPDAHREAIIGRALQIMTD